MMTASKIQWHLARDNQLSLHKFCEKNRVKQIASPVFEVDGKKYFTITYHFDNMGFVKAELRAGDANRGYTVADHFQVVEYELGATL